MSVAIQWGYPVPSPGLTQGFIYFDAVTSIDESYSGEVSRNPIDGGGNIADHFTRDNPKVTFSGVISAVDISAKYKLIRDTEGNRPSNLRAAPEPVKVNDDGLSGLNFLPSFIGQFFKPTSPEVVIGIQSSEIIQTVKQTLTNLFKDGQVQLVTLYQYEGNNLRYTPLKNLIMTSLRFRETPETGNALFCDVSLEQVTFSNAKKTQLPEEYSQALVSQDLKNKSNTTDDLGKQDSTEKDVTPDLLQRRESSSILVEVFGGGN